MGLGGSCVCEHMLTNIGIMENHGEIRQNAFDATNQYYRQEVKA